MSRTIVAGVVQRIIKPINDRRAATHAQRGDADRDRRQWSEAAIHYRNALLAKPDWTEIWVQLGHALKEAGNLAEGQIAYERALELRPSDSDAALSMGHVLKLQRKIEDAESWYAKSLSLDPSNRNAITELVALGWTAERIHKTAPPARKVLTTVAQLGSEPEVAFDVSRPWKALVRGRAMDRALVWILQVTTNYVEKHGGVLCVEVPDSEELRVLGKLEIESIRTYISGEVPHFESGTSIELLSASNGPICLCTFILECDQPGNVWPTFNSSLADRWCSVVSILVPWDVRLELTLLSDSSWGRWQRAIPILRYASAAIVFCADDEQALQCLRDASDLHVVSGATIGSTVVGASQAEQGMRVATADLRANYGRSLCIVSSNPNETATILRAWERFAAPRDNLVLVGIGLSHSAFEEDEVSRLERKQLSVEFLNPDWSLVRSQMLDVDTVVVSPQRPDAQLWIGDALAAGRRVLAPLTTEIYTYWKSRISYYSIPIDEELLAQDWRDLLLRTPGTSPLPGSNGNNVVGEYQLEKSLRLLLPRVTYSRGSPSTYVKIGTYYTFHSESVDDETRCIGDGRRLCAAASWGESHSNGLMMRSEIAALMLNIEDQLFGMFRLACLVETNGLGTLAINVEQAKTVYGSTKVEFNEPCRRWVQLDWERKSAPTQSTHIVTFQIPGKESAESTSFTLKGLILYPLAEDHLWYEFLDRVSRSIISLGSLR